MVSSVQVRGRLGEVGHGVVEAGLEPRHAEIAIRSLERGVGPSHGFRMDAAVQRQVGAMASTPKDPLPSQLPQVVVPLGTSGPSARRQAAEEVIGGPASDVDRPRLAGPVPPKPLLPLGSRQHRRFEPPWPLKEPRVAAVDSVGEQLA